MTPHLTPPPPTPPPWTVPVYAARLDVDIPDTIVDADGMPAAMPAGYLNIGTTDLNQPWAPLFGQVNMQVTVDLWPNLYQVTGLTPASPMGAATRRCRLWAIGFTVTDDGPVYVGRCLPAAEAEPHDTHGRAVTFVGRHDPHTGTSYHTLYGGPGFTPAMLGMAPAGGAA